MKQDTSWRTRLVLALRSKNLYILLAFIILIGVIIWQQVQISALQYQQDLDHDGSTYESYAGRIYNLEGISNKHGEVLEEQKYTIQDLRQQIATLDWEIKQLQWQHPELQVIPPSSPAKNQEKFDPNPGKVPDIH